jgi:hypothetical protein
MTQWLQRQTISGDKTQIGDTVVTPQSQSIMLRWPYGGLVWNRPAAVLVEQDNQTTRIPIIDITRILIWGFLGLGLFFGIMTALLSNQQRRKNNE